MQNGIRSFIACILAFTLGGCNSFVETAKYESLPYYEEASFTPKWFSSKEPMPKEFHQISSFELLNQNGETISEKHLAGKIYVADFFFTICPGICPKMTANMGILQDSFINDPDVVLLSHSVTPERDSVSVLKAYAESKDIIDGKWHLLTGERDVVYSLGRNDYFVEEDLGMDKGLEEFLHTENFVLVDGNSHIRGIYNGLNLASIDQLVKDIRLLQGQK